MKAKTLIACAITASALPFAALAQNAEPSGPQGTGWYGAPNAARATPQENQIAERNARIERRADTRERYRDRRAYDGFSADTNPPAPTY
jgi:hypothetical protein